MGARYRARRLVVGAVCMFVAGMPALDAAGWPIPPGAQGVDNSAAGAAAGAAGTPVAPPGESAGMSRPAVSFPHPLIVEVLYAVPTGPGGDANQDGTRHASGDEFIEIVNPHDKPIQLLGYTLTDGSQSEKAKVRFTFPACVVAPGRVVVVFNGNGATWVGPVGDSKAAPAKGNDRFAGALVFTMRVTSAKVALGNEGDEVLLTAPNNKPVQRLRWGTAAEGAKPDPAVPLEETLPLVKRASVVRSGVEAGAAWRAHNEVDGRMFSPGEYTLRLKDASEQGRP